MDDSVVLDAGIAPELGSRWSARSKARTNDLEAREDRRRLADDLAGGGDQVMGALLRRSAMRAGPDDG